MKLFALLAIAACGQPTSSPEPSSAKPAPSVTREAPKPIDAAAVIAKLWPDGCFMVRDASGMLRESDHARCAQPRRPYSTFKLPNAMIAVDAGILDGPDASMTWDKQAIPDEAWYRDVWRKPHTLRSGIAVSAVPYFRTLARQIGEPRMRAGLAKLAYGNQDMSGGLDRFWLGGGIRISAAQQLEFVDALARGKLAVSARAQEVVRDVSTLERAGSSVLHGKTGSGPIEDENAGDNKGGSGDDENGGSIVWQVGWIELGKTIVPYACWMQQPGKIDDLRTARDKRLRATLDGLGMFPAPKP
jgi:beta-lactamase class D